MSKIKAFENGKVLIPCITAGDPDIETTEKLLVAISEGGADIIEISIPFSDPIAEGATVQEAYIRSLGSGTTTDRIFEMLERVKPKLACDLAVITYMNPIFVYGTDKFMQKCSECGVVAVTVPDVPFEEREELKPYCDKYGVNLITMFAPTSDDRLTMLSKASQGYGYCFAGEKIDVTKAELAKRISMVKSVSDLPCVVSSEIHTPEDAKTASEIADGVVIGSAVVEIIGKHGKDSIDKVRDYVRELKEAMS
ncbi:MAG: tryptophan synthase subunit alpha [Ruminococcus sp.]|nr:tryptophan synthase subunit alpha [Ruminococcus sp.]